MRCRPVGFLMILTCVVGFCAPGVSGLEVGGIRLLSEHGSTRSTRYAVTNKILTLDGKTHIAWLDSISQTMVATYDHAAKTWGPTVKAGDGKDNHGGPALTCDSQGFLHIVFGPHVGPFQYCRSTRPNDASNWVKLPDFGESATYPSMVCDDKDTLHIIYRGGPAPHKLMYQQLPQGGAWSEPRTLARANIESGYTHYHSSLTIAGDQSLHISYDIFHNGAAKAAGHMMSRDRGATWTLADGAEIELPVTPASNAFFKRTDDALKTVGVVCDTENNPWMVVTGPEIWHHDKANWRCIPVKPALPDDIDASKLAGPGPLGLDAEDRLYLPILYDGSVALLHSDDHGVSFEMFSVFPQDDKLPHTGLSIERPTGHHSVQVPWLLFATGEKGPDCYGKGIHQYVRAVQLKR